MKEKTYVEDIDRNIYDFKDDEKDAYKIKAGLTPEIVEQLSKEKHDPAWMQTFRLESLQIYNNMEVPDWGPSIEGLNMDNIVTYVRPNTNMKAKWSDVPEDIKNTFERLGIPQAERKSLAGVGAQYDSELVYHNVRQEVAEKGVVYTDMESALNGEYADMVRKHFMKLVRPNDHKFAALHGAVWSGGSFVYVPKGVSVEIPLQSYFRLNAPGAGQFEHTLIIVDEGADLHFIEGCSAPKYNVANLHAGCVELFVGKNAKIRYSTIENWSKNMYNLNTKRAVVEEGGTIAGKGAEGDVRGSFSKYADLTQRAIHVQKTIIRKLADRESCVIIGRSADYILKEQKPILRIFIYSPEDVRIENVMKSHNFSAEDAKLFITEKDKRYHKRHLALTGSNRGDRHNRDMLIDSSLLGVDGTAELIEEVAKKVFHE